MSTYKLLGEWAPSSTRFLMKALFCRTVDYLKISDENMANLKEFASLGEPFSLTDYNKIFDDFRDELQKDPPHFIRSYLEEIKLLQWPKESFNFLISLITGLNSFQTPSGFQIVLLKIVRNLAGRRWDNTPADEAIRQMQCSIFDIDYFLENQIISATDEEMLFTITNEHNYDSIEDDFDFPAVYVSEDYLRNKEQGDLLILIDSKISRQFKSVTMKYEEIHSFQELLDLLYNQILIHVVKEYSYGKEWVLSKYNGVAFSEINQPQKQDMKSLHETGIFKNDILLIRKLREHTQ